MKLEGTHHLTLTVSDLQRTADWYGSVLGFQEVVRYRNDVIAAHCAVLAHPSAARPPIGLRQYDTKGDTGFDEHRIGLDHLAFDAGDEDTLRQWHAHLRQLGVPFTEVRLPELSITTLRDPDNIQLELIAVDPSPVGSSIDQSGRLKVPGQT
jgi:catechol 2,3-dioxygenase-like lactoylglutathione lyase family enzyme